MDAKEYLEQIGKNECIIANKLIEKQHWLDMAAGTTVSLGERVQSSGSKQSMENKVVEANMIDAEIDKLKAEISCIIKTLERLNKNEYDFLHKMYVQHLSMKEIHVASGKSYSWAKSTHKRALCNLQKVLDE